jgi:hypothetical protein
MTPPSIDPPPWPRDPLAHADKPLERWDDPFACLLILAFGIILLLGRNVLADALTSRRGPGSRWRAFARWECLVIGAASTLYGVVGLVSAFIGMVFGVLGVAQAFI